MPSPKTKIALYDLLAVVSRWVGLILAFPGLCVIGVGEWADNQSIILDARRKCQHDPTYRSEKLGCLLCGEKNERIDNG